VQEVRAIEQMKNNVISLSGGKDSCGMALLMHEKGIPIYELVYVDVGSWEFPQTRKMTRKIAQITGAKLITLHPPPFDWWMLKRLVVHNDGSIDSGAGWPSRELGRWCTREKFKVFDKYMNNTLVDPIKCVGFAADEAYRTESKEQITRKEKGEKFRYPLIEFGLSEEDALQLCYRYGIDWDGLYEIFRTGKRTPRMSCWCCPHQPVPSLRILRKKFPSYWAKMIKMHEASSNKVFKGWTKDGTAKTIEDFERRFAEEDRQMDLFESIEES
jgi:3'-phosphoadenosine 5'-phosphosulfate sulfotransferase (PAPS reductase)/FAD synthetase